MNRPAERRTPPRTDGLKILAPERLLQWLAETAEDAMGLSYELNLIRSENLTRGDAE
jgi:hypothetical protein